jgi:hypothetical protein
MTTTKPLMRIELYAAGGEKPHVRQRHSQDEYGGVIVVDILCFQTEALRVTCILPHQRDIPPPSLGQSPFIKNAPICGSRIILRARGAIDITRWRRLTAVPAEGGRKWHPRHPYLRSDDKRSHQLPGRLSRHR